MCKEDAKIELNDGANIIFFNLAADANSAPESTRNMLQYFSSGAINDNSTKIIDTAVSTAREKEEWRQEYMLTYVHDKDVYNEGYSDGHAEGLAEGIEQSTMKSIANVMKNGSLSFDAACDLLSIDDREKYRKQI